MRITSAGHALFAATLIAIAIQGFVQGDFGAIWQPVPKGVPAREILIYLCAAVSLLSGAGLLWPRLAAPAARVLFIYLLVWMLLFKVSVILGAPTVEVAYESCGETAVIVAAAWILYAGFASEWDRRYLAFATGERGVRLARILFALALIAFGLSHFAYLKLTASLVPAWLPAHVGWARFTGAAYLAAGIAVLIGVLARSAAALTALQMGLFTVLIWVPILAAGTHDPSMWTEAIVSWALTVAAWVVADSYRGTSWFAVGKR